MKNILIMLILVISLFLSHLSLAQEQTQQNIKENTKEYIAKVLEIISETNDNNIMYGQKTQKVKIKVLNGDAKDKIIVTDNVLSGNPGYDIVLKKNDKLLINIEEQMSGIKDTYIVSNYRLPALLIIVALFVALLLILGGKKGLKSLIGLLITYLLIFLVFIPAILNGVKPIPITIFISIIITCVSIFLVTGINLKGISAVIGTLGGIIIAAIVTLLAIKYANLSGTPNEEAIALWAMQKGLDFKGIFASALIIGALGVSMDVSMSIASSIFEVKKACPESTPVELIKAGLNVGKDIMGANTNTILLAYTGSALFLLLLVYNNVSTMKLLNLDSIVSEIVVALVGSITLLLCIPLTALSAGFLQRFSNEPR